VDTPEEILHRFIESETFALSRNEQGTFWPQNHHRITPLIKRAHKILDEEMLSDFFFHLLRLNRISSLKSEAALLTLCLAYRRVIPLLGQGYPICMLPRLKGLFLFGFNDLGELQSEPPLTLDLINEYLGLWRYIDSFTNIPGMIKKRTKFIEYSENKLLLIRVQKTLTLTRFTDEMSGPLLLWLWALIFLTLQHEETGVIVVNKIINEDLSSRDYTSMLEILRRYVEASKQNSLMKIIDEGKN
jgi:hypothetical protein